MKPDTIDDTALVALLNCRHSSTTAFNIIYNRYAELLLRYVIDRIRIKEASEEIIQDLFESLWQRRTSLAINSLRSYLFNAASHKILNYYRHERIVERHKLTAFVKDEVDNSTAELLELNELQQRIESFIKELPERCQEAYRKSRIEHQSIDEIAISMNISRRTVENQITKSLKHLRQRLNDDF